MGMSFNVSHGRDRSIFKAGASFALAGALLVYPVLSHSDLTPVSDFELSFATAQANLPGLPLSEGLDFNIEGGGVELDLEIQTSIDSIEWQDNDGSSDNGTAGALILKGVHIGSSQTPITADQVRNAQPFEASELALIKGLVIEADPKKGTLITLNELGDTQGNGIDIIVNDIYFGQDLSDQGQRGIGLLVEDFSNFISDDYLERMNQLHGLSLSSVDDGKNTEGGNYYPLRIAIQPLEGETQTIPALDTGLTDALDEVIAIPGFGGTSMRIDAEFVVYMDKLAIYKEGFEAGIKGLMIYQGVDTTGNGIEDTVGPVVVNNLRMETMQHKLSDGSDVQAMHFSNIDINMDIAMESVYIGNPQTGSLGSIHIDNLHIHDTQLWIYPH